MDEKTCKCENCIELARTEQLDEPCMLNGHIGSCYICPDNDCDECSFADEHFTELS